MADREPRKKPATGSVPDGHDGQLPDGNTTEGAPERKRRFQKRLAEKVEQTLAEHPDGSAPSTD
jgi:hypothetical protein